VPLRHINITASAYHISEALALAQGFRFFSWFDEVRPSWYTAVPTMHQAVAWICPTQQGHYQERSAASHSVLVRFFAAFADGGAGRDIQRTGDRELRHD
jgi:hypothetical protein